LVDLSEASANQFNNMHCFAIARNPTNRCHHHRTVEQSGFHLAPEKVTLNFSILDHIERRPNEN